MYDFIFQHPEKSCHKAGCCRAAKRQSCGDDCECKYSWHQDGSDQGKRLCDTGNCNYECLWCKPGNVNP